MKPLKLLSKREKEKLIYLTGELGKLQIGYVQMPQKGKIITLMNNSNYWETIIDYGFDFIDRYHLKDSKIDFIEGIRPE